MISDFILGKLNNDVEPKQIAAAGLVIPVRKETRQVEIVCPICANGSGRDATGIIPKKMDDNHWAYHCTKCQESFNTISLVRAAQNVDFAEACEMIARVGGFDIEQEDDSTINRRPVTVTAPKVEEQKSKDSIDIKIAELIVDDLTSPDNTLDEYAKKYSDYWRGLPISFLKDFGCRYVSNWIHPKLRANESSSNQFGSERILIPSSKESYLARAISSTTKVQKQHAGTKSLFNPSALRTTGFCFVVEGYIDSLSITFVDDGRREWTACAMGGVGESDLLIDSVRDILTEGLHPKIILLLDPDESGRAAEPKIKSRLKALGVATFSRFLSDEISKLDANQILQENGRESLYFRLKKIIDSVTSEADAEKLNQTTHTTKETKAMQDNIFAVAPAQVEDSSSEKIAEDFHFKDNQSSLVVNTVAPKATIVDGINLIPISTPIKHKRTIDDVDLHRLFAGDSSDIDFSNRLKTFAGDIIRRVPQADCWLTYESSTGLWERGNHGSIENLVPIACELSDLLNRNAKRLDKKETEQRQAEAPAGKDVVPCTKRANLAKAFKAASKIKSAINLLVKNKSLKIKLSDLDKHKSLLPCRNGVINLTDGQLYHAAPELLLTKSVNGVYLPNAADTTFAESFFKSIQPNEQTRNYLLRFLGYSLSGHTYEHKCLLFNGEAATGKTTLLNFIKSLFGDYACTLSKNAFIQQTKYKDGLRATTSLNPIEGARFAASDELDEHALLDEATLKGLTGGDVFVFRRHFEEEHNAEVTAKIVLCSNFLPRFNTDDTGVARRIVNIRFTQRFGHEGYPAQDKKLIDKIKAPENLNALLNLLVREAVAWYRDGLLQPSAEMIQATEIHKESSDFVGAFIEQFFDGRASNQTYGKEIVDAMQEHCKEARNYSYRELCQKILKDKRISETKDRRGTRIFVFEKKD